MAAPTPDEVALLPIDDVETANEKHPEHRRLGKRSGLLSCTGALLLTAAAIALAASPRMLQKRASPVHSSRGDTISLETTRCKLQKLRDAKGDCGGNDVHGKSLHAGSASKCLESCLDVAACKYFIYWPGKPTSAHDCYPKHICNRNTGGGEAYAYTVESCGQLHAEAATTQPISTVHPTTEAPEEENSATGGHDEKDDKGCCSFGGHTECAKPWDNCHTGLQGKCCSDYQPDKMKDCEECNGEWITLPQSMCDTGHSIEKPLPHIFGYSSSAKKHATVKVLSYNLFWWKLMDKEGGNGGSAGKLIKQSAEDAPYDIMGFQECTQPYRVLSDAGMDKDFLPWHTNQNICICYRKAAWEELEKGEHIVANDANVPGQNFGQRTGQWIRLRNKETNETLFFVNHHGPLPLSSGGQGGGPSVAYNLLRLIQRNATKGDAVVMTGDFNSVATSWTVKQLGCGLNRVFSGTKFGGVDHIFSNLGGHHIVSTKNLGQGGSDHDAINAVISLR